MHHLSELQDRVCEEELKRVSLKSFSDFRDIFFCGN